MSRIAATFAALAERGRKALIPYVTAGDPHADTTAQIMQALADGGADIIELGVPFSDPMADGPVIQKASERALDHRAVGHGIGERHAQLDDVGARGDQRAHHVERHVERRVTDRDIGHERGTALGAQARERRVDPVRAARHGWRAPLAGTEKSRPERSATVAMSLSPRPDRLTSSRWSFGSVGASFAA